MNLRDLEYMVNTIAADAQMRSLRLVSASVPPALMHELAARLGAPAPVAAMARMHVCSGTVTIFTSPDESFSLKMEPA